MHRRLTTIVLTATALAVAACGTHGAKGPQPGTPVPGTASISTSASPTTSAPARRPTTSPGANPCATETGWSTAVQDGGAATTTAPLYLVRVGQHGCYDRVVFDINAGDEVGYVVHYAPVVDADPSAAPVPVNGRAALQVVIRAPIWGMDSQGHQPWRRAPAVGADLIDPAQTAGWAALTGVKFAGSFEGQTTIAVGVREKVPFRVWVRSEHDYRHVVLDLAHPVE
jgi:hypothetical protein